MSLNFVILAAGNGSRFNQLTSVIPKPLIRFWDKPLIYFNLQNMAENVPRLKEVIIITGFQKELIENYIENIKTDFPFEIRCVFAPNYRKGNGFSLMAAEPFIDDYFYLSMCDHLFESTFYESISFELKNKYDISLCVDFKPSFNIILEDATKIFIDNNMNIQNIGKKIDYWNAIDTGLFLMSPKIFTRIKQVSRDNITVSDALKEMICRQDSVKGINVSKALWADIDTFSDLYNAEIVFTQQLRLEF